LPETTPTPSATPEETPTPSPKVTPRKKVSPTPSASPKSSALPSPTKSGTAPVSIAASEIAGYEKYSPEVRKVLDLSLDLTTRNLNYKYGSADPANGGMDCSGFVYYVLGQIGLKDVPRDAREQYVWVRKAGRFQAVLGRSPDTFELDALKPGDLMFWAGTYNVDRDPGITHVMIYLGREKANDQRIMVGASDGRTYKGQSRFGVSVFDFKMAGRKMKSPNEPGPTFVGYASIPGLNEEANAEHRTPNAERRTEEGEEVSVERSAATQHKASPSPTRSQKRPKPRHTPRSSSEKDED